LQLFVAANNSHFLSSGAVLKDCAFFVFPAGRADWLVKVQTTPGQGKGQPDGKGVHREGGTMTPEKSADALADTFKHGRKND
jgi:hypothetical protein